MFSKNWSSDPLCNEHDAVKLLKVIDISFFSSQSGTKSTLKTKFQRTSLLAMTLSTRTFLSEFHPEAESISAYLERLELFFTANSITDEKKVVVFLSVDPSFDVSNLT